MRAPDHTVTTGAATIQLWGFQKLASGRSCECWICKNCGTGYAPHVLSQLVDKCARLGLLQVDAHCCVWPPSSVPNSCHIGKLLRKCGMKSVKLARNQNLPAPAVTVTPATRAYIKGVPPKTLTNVLPPMYPLEHKGETFWVHGITAVPTSSMLRCTECGQEFSIDFILSVMETVLSTKRAHRDFTCCKDPPSAAIGVVNLRTLYQEAMSPEPDKPKAVCRWCKGKGELTFNFKTKPCECVKQENIGTGRDALRKVGEDIAKGDAMAFLARDVGRGWKVKKTFNTEP